MTSNPRWLAEWEWTIKKDEKKDGKGMGKVESAKEEKGDKLGKETLWTIRLEWGDSADISVVGSQGVTVWMAEKTQSVLHYSTAETGSWITEQTALH